VRAQLRKGVLEYCVLACVASGPTYGFEIAKKLGGYADLLTSEGTLYPLLSRLRTQGMLRTAWQASPAGPPRRYYSLTADGRAALRAFIDTWTPFSQAVSAVLAEV
jgi:PadR family transcriptional regulator PadR